MNLFSVTKTFFVVATATLSACGGGSGSGSSTVNASGTSQGVFLDAAVTGMGYVCGSSSGITDSAGRFSYTPGDTCVFRIGGVTVGSAAGSATITPVTLVSGATDETHPTVANIARFLQSLDTDNDANNGINIDSTVGTALGSSTLSFSSSSFASDAQALVAKAINGRTLVTEAAAQSHLKNSLLAKFAGTYNCSYSGTDRGTAIAIVSSSGAISGTANSNAFNFSCPLAGASASSGQATFSTGGGTCGSASFSGILNLAGNGSGNWSGIGTSGTWSCSKS